MMVWKNLQMTMHRGHNHVTVLQVHLRGQPPGGYRAEPKPADPEPEGTESPHQREREARDRYPHEDSLPAGTSPHPSRYVRLNALWEAA